jgi:hypothetical protein
MEPVATFVDGRNFYLTYSKSLVDGAVAPAGSPIDLLVDSAGNGGYPSKSTDSRFEGRMLDLGRRQAHPSKNPSAWE